MIKELTDNSHKKFKDKTDKYYSMIGDEIVVRNNCGYLSILEANDKWEEVKQPATWQEALEA